jgi:hypothetical protein
MVNIRSVPIIINKLILIALVDDALVDDGDDLSQVSP